MVQIGKKVAAGPKKGKKALTFTIDCAKPVEDKVRGDARPARIKFVKKNDPAPRGAWALATQERPRRRQQAVSTVCSTLREALPAVNRRVHM